VYASDHYDYDETRFEPTCSNCGSSDFKRSRVYHEVQILDLEGGVAEIADTDLHDQDSATFECERCGNSGSELEDLLTEIEEDDDEEGDEYEL
jgi:predicted nucleic-acid-binding Zn-ribbon protein